MVRSIWYMTPPSIHGDVVFRILRGEWTCPWCQAETAKEDGANDIGWVETPLRSRSPRYICDGCAIDVYSTCARDDFETHPYKDIVREVAAMEGIPLDVFRRICVQDQVEIINSQLQKADSPDVQRRRNYLLALLKHL